MELIDHAESTRPTIISSAERLDEQALEVYIATTQRRYNLPPVASDFLEGWNNTERALMYSSTGQSSNAENCASWALYDLSTVRNTLEHEARHNTALMPVFIDTCMALANWPSIENRLYGTAISPNKSFRFRADFVEIARYALQACHELPENDDNKPEILGRAAVALGTAFLARQPDELGWPQLASPRERLGRYNVYTMPVSGQKKRMRFLRYWNTNKNRPNSSVAIMPLGNILNRAEFKGNSYDAMPTTDPQRTAESFWLALSALENELQEKECDIPALDRTMLIMQQAFTVQQMS